MTRTFAFAILGLLATAGIVAAEEYDAVIDKPPKAAADGTVSLRHEKIQQDSKARVVSRVILTAALTKETKYAMGKFNEQRKKWEATEPIKEGAESLVFKDADTNKLQARVTTSDDHKTILQILVKKIGGELEQAGPEYDGVIKQVVQGGCWVLKVELDDKGEILQTFGVSSCSTTKETKVSMGNTMRRRKNGRPVSLLKKGFMATSSRTSERHRSTRTSSHGRTIAAWMRSSSEKSGGRCRRRNRGLHVRVDAGSRRSL